MKVVSLALACFVASLMSAPAGASALRSPAMRLPVAATTVRPMALAATRGTYAGQMAPAESISILVRLPGLRDAELDRFVASLSVAGSMSPRYLTPQEFGRYFGADPTLYARAIATLRTAGFVIDDLPANRTDIIAHAPAMRVAALFNTPIDQRIERGRVFFTSRYEPVIPASFGAALVSGLDDYVQFHPLGFRLRSPRGGGVYWSPADLAAAYNLNPLYAKNLDGKGVTIANATSAAASSSDLNLFQQHFGLPIVPMLSTAVGGPLSKTCGHRCNNGESSLDADSATSIAREATFHQVVAHTPSNHDFDLAYDYIVNNLGGTVHVVTTSWGICEREIMGTKSIKIDEKDFEQAAAEGQFWFSASGDNGTDDCDSSGTALSADFPGTSPFVISVGGTNVAGKRINGVVTKWTGETTWQYSNSDGASGGGKSILYQKPVYQKGRTPNDGVRDVPDVSLIADNVNDGVWVCIDGICGGGAGGTSEASPMWAAFLAVIEQSKNGKSLVDPHARLYQLADSSRYRDLFHDITSGNNGVPSGDDPYYPTRSFQGFKAGKGFDLATGWGSFNGAPLLEAY